MKILQQLLLILAFTFLGKSLQVVFHLPVPGSVLGMVFLFIALCTGIIKEKQLALVGDYLIENLSILFLPAGVGLMLYLDMIKDSFAAVLFILLATFVVSIFVVGRISQWIKTKKEPTEVNIMEGDAQHATSIDE